MGDLRFPSPEFFHRTLRDEDLEYHIPQEEPKKKKPRLSRFCTRCGKATQTTADKCPTCGRYY